MTLEYRDKKSHVWYQVVDQGSAPEGLTGSGLMAASSYDISAQPTFPIVGDQGGQVLARWPIREPKQGIVLFDIV